ncbi:hypothetical protein DPMN_053179 [Dreissena polymorpha]|uniref:Uncharacterized protein n=1 Tax=Dreissena polymorpha TaxID=45954 RepID=A0A9D4CKW1_DREPO|nr:hypothetical protein DPMN_053179 [Dreissena polymorpha]
MLSVKATCHQGNLKYGGAGRQCAANSLVAMQFAKHKDPENWNQTDLDTILSSGDSVYCSISLKNEANLLISELPTDTFHVEKTFSGSIFRNVSEPPFATLHDSLVVLK